MLTVIAIIGILAALMSGAMVAVRARVQKAAISAEIKQLEMALEAYKTTYGEYPPDGTDGDAVRRHLAKAFPRANGLNVTGIKPENALVFWLGGPIVDGHPIGFSKNPTSPELTGKSSNTPRTTPLYDFNPAQFRTVSGVFATYTSKTGGDPYIYFKSRVDNGKSVYTLPNSTNVKQWVNPDNANDIAYPYKKNNIWYGENRFQILSPGLDGIFGKGGENINNAVKDSNAFDNQTNFGDIEDLAD